MGLFDWFKNKVYEGKVEGTLLKIYWQSRLSPNDLLDKVGNKVFIAFLLKKLKEQRIFTKFNHITLVFDDSHKFKVKGGEDQVQALLRYINESSEVRRLAYVKTDEVDADKNRIYIHFNILFAKEVASIPVEKRNQGKDVIFNMMERMVGQISEMLRHESVHLWHVKQNKTKHIIKRQLKRFNKFYKKFSKANNLFSKDEDLIHIYANLRNFFFKILQWIVLEGLAEYLAKEEKFDFSEETFNLNYREAYQKTEELNYYLSGLIKKLEELFLKRKDNKNYDWDKVGNRIIIKQVKYMVMNDLNTAKNFIYVISPNIYYTILFSNSELTPELLSNMDHRDLLKIYLTSCKKLGLKPLIAIPNTDAIISYARLVGQLNIMRKRVS